ncbi:hypothetical protein [Salinisphaera orenii]|uniref:hypothetical protein n=1 Tax=Salinisphaera orenii TaxID=856731 RepID=UPI000DBE73EE
MRRIEALRSELKLSSDAEVIRRAIDSYDPDELSVSEREQVEATAADLLTRIENLNQNIEHTLERATQAREKLNDPAWIEAIRERTRREAAADPALVAGVADLIEA